jgi:polyhydroxyalkanoate synthesis repressor PhaR
MADHDTDVEMGHPQLGTVRDPAAPPPVVVKKYANRRLYNTEASSYVTLEDLAAMVRQGRDFVVYDAKSGDDITRGVLTQIIVEEESKGRSLLPESFLRQIIGFYGDSLQAIVPRYLEMAMAGFARQQEQMRQAMAQTIGLTSPLANPLASPLSNPLGAGIGGFLPFGSLEEVGKQNRAMIERAMSLFAPFRLPDAPAAAPPPAAEPGGPSLADLSALQSELDRLRRQVAELQAAPKTEG